MKSKKIDCRNIAMTVLGSLFFIALTLGSSGCQRLSDHSLLPPSSNPGSK